MRSQVSVERAEYVAIFGAQQAFDFEKARTAVEEAGFSYQGMELIARGRVRSAKLDDGATGWLLIDEKVGMHLRLTAAEEDSIFRKLVEAASNGVLPDTVQARGVIVEVSERSGTQVALALTTFEPAEKAVLPPLVAGKSADGKKPEANGR